MSASQPPNKRRRLSNNNIQNIPNESTNSNTHQIQLPSNYPSYPHTSQDAENNMNHFLNSWQSFVNTHLNYKLPPNINFPISIHSNNNNNNNNNNNTLSNNSNMDEIKKLKTENIELKRLNNELNRNNNNLRDELCKKDKQIRNYKQKYNCEMRQKELYQLRLKGLSQMIKTGPPPHFERVNMNKMNLRMSEKIHNIKQKINENYFNKYKNTMHININNYDNHKWMNKKSLIQMIKNHINYNNKNKNNPSKPYLLIRKQKQRRQSNRNKNKNKANSPSVPLDIISGNLNNYDSIPWDFILNVFRIKQNSHRIPALGKGYQRGIKTRSDIPIGTVIGEYIGVEYTFDEFQSIFNHSNEEAVRNVYAFDCILTEPASDNNNGDKPIKMVMDGYGLREMVTAYNQRNAYKIKNGSGIEECEYSAHLMYINDCRLDISMDKPTEEDSKYWNVDFVDVEVNGIPKVFLITRCDVKGNTELMTYYGDSYDVAINQQNEYERMRNSVITMVDNSVLRGVDLSKDTWTIE